MKILFINQDLDVKQYHLACALTDKYNIECHLALLFPNGLNWKRALSAFPHPRGMLYFLRTHRAFMARQLKNDTINPFKTVKAFNKHNLLELDPDLVYISSNTDSTFDYRNLGKYPIFYDIEDFIEFDKDIVGYKKAFTRMMENHRIIHNPMVLGVGFGSLAECKSASMLFGPEEHGRKPYITLYPFVAKRTLPKKVKDKTNIFSIVYAGSFWRGDGYKDISKTFLKILSNGLDLTVYIVNSWHKPTMEYLKSITSNYDNFHIKPVVSFGKIKEEISCYHVGLKGGFIGYKKTKATFGMKPLEYAYADVQPVSLGHSLNNLSDNKEFGYCTTPEDIQYNYQNNLENFDWNYHLMDNHLADLRSLIE